MTTLAQAIRNAIEAEQAAARFYDQLITKASDDDARGFLASMAAEERSHAKSLAELAERLEAGELPARADTNVQGIETLPDWPNATAIEFSEAIEIAIEAENSAALYYDALADFSAGEVAEFFRRLVALEDSHAETLRTAAKRG